MERWRAGCSDRDGRESRGRVGVRVGFQGRGPGGREGLHGERRVDGERG